MAQLLRWTLRYISVHLTAYAYKRHREKRRLHSRPRVRARRSSLRWWPCVSVRRTAGRRGVRQTAGGRGAPWSLGAPPPPSAPPACRSAPRGPPRRAAPAPRGWTSTRAATRRSGRAARPAPARTLADGRRRCPAPGHGGTRPCLFSYLGNVIN